jgi:hypothetical protein
MPGSVLPAPFESVNANRQLRDLATQLRCLPGPFPQFAQIEPDFRDLTRNEVTQLRHFVLQPADTFGERVHPITQLSDLGAQLREISTQLQVLRLLQLEEVVHAGEASVHAGFHAGETCARRLAQSRNGGARFGIHDLEDSVALRAIQRADSSVSRGVPFNAPTITPAPICTPARAKMPESGGLIISLAIDRVAGGMITRQLPVLLPVVAIIMTTVGLLAALGPARRGLAVQQTEALRSD